MRSKILQLLYFGLNAINAACNEYYGILFFNKIFDKIFKKRCTVNLPKCPGK